MPEKERVDVLMVSRGLVPSREKAQAFLMAGSVFVDGRTEYKPGTKVSAAAEITLKEDPIPYASRGGLKLAAALDAWDISPDGCACVDIGASTGGFTDVMLKRGAARVYAIDVGYGQLDYRLREDERVCCMERVNVRYLDTEAFPEKANLITIDVSFISLKLVLPVAAKLLETRPVNHAGSHETDTSPIIGASEAKLPSIIALVKPQFEAERGQVGKGGIVRDAKTHAEVLEKVRGYAAEAGLFFRDQMESPITGAKGNHEFLMWLGKKEAEDAQS